MKKSFLFAAVAVLALGACTKVDSYTEVAPEVVNFGAYSGRVQTKAGPTDDMNLKYLAQDGFGVFATYTGKEAYNPASVPADNNFMFNQQVTGTYDETTNTASDWTYTPVKYWPNPTDGVSKTAQKVSFFAYAPYANPGTTEAYGITGFAIEGGENIVNYSFRGNGPNVDLMWGYRSRTGSGTSGDPYVYTVNNDRTRDDNTVPFIFQHMLAKLGGSQEGDPAVVGANGLIVKANPVIAPTVGLASNTGTKITISKIEVKSADKDMLGTDIEYLGDTETIDGKLNLNTGVFSITSSPIKPVKFSQVVSANATEIAAGASEIATNLKEVPGLTDFTAVKPGVTTSAVNVYKDEKNPLILVPGTAPVVEVEITYVVRTYDDKLPGTKKFSEVPQTVWGKVPFPTIEKNKKYNLCIIIGLDNVKFTATVEDWTNGRTDTNGDGVVDEKDDVTVYLPENL